MEICRLLKEAGMTMSVSEARRLVAEGAVHVGEVRIEDPLYVVDPSGHASDDGLVIRIGRRRYIRVKFSAVPN